MKLPIFSLLFLALLSSCESYSVKKNVQPSPNLTLDTPTSDIKSTIHAFAYRKVDGSVITWGHSGYGGDSSSVDLNGGVKEITSTDYSFAAVKEDGSVVTWGILSPAV